MSFIAPLQQAIPRQPLCAPDAGQCVAEIKPVCSLTEVDRARWSRLTARAGSGNIFATDWFMASALRHCAPGTQVQLAIIRTLDGEWIGVVPITFERMLGRCPLPSWQTWFATNQFDATPLIEFGAEHVFWDCLLRWFDRNSGFALALCCEDLPLDSPVTAALIEVGITQGRRLYQTGQTNRPMRRAGALDDAARTARCKLDKRLNGLQRKLEREVGGVRIASLAPQSDPSPWIARFLALECAGWKGVNASALICDNGTAGMFREVIRIAHQQGAARLMSLEAGGAVIAMSSWFVHNRHGYGFKMAFDERYRAYGPGRVLMRAAALQAEHEKVRLFDSCARHDAPPDPLWPHSRELASYVVSIGSPARCGMLATAMQLRDLRQPCAARRIG